MKNDSCIFCKIANGEIPSATLYEDEDFRVILDANPAAKGHALILPKEHYANLYELDDELAGKSMILAKKMITKLTKALDCDGYNIVQNNGEAAGQTVFHYHVHMIPRHKDDKVGLGWTMHELTEEEKELYTKQLGDVLKYVDQMNEVDTSDVKPMTQVIDFCNVMREDKVVQEISKEALMSNAPEVEGDFFKVPKIN